MTRKSKFSIGVIHKPERKAIVQRIEAVYMVVLKFSKGYEHVASVSEDGIVNITARKKSL